MAGISAVGADDERRQHVGVDVDRALFEGVEVVLQGRHPVAARVLFRAVRVAELYGRIFDAEIRDPAH